MCHLNAFRGNPFVIDVHHFFGRAFFNGYFIAGCQGKVQSRDWRGDIKRNIIFLGEHCSHIGAYFVGDIAISRNAVGPDNDQIDFLIFHKKTAHTIGDQLDGNIVLLEFPSGQSCPLQERPGFVC